MEIIWKNRGGRPRKRAHSTSLWQHIIIYVLWNTFVSIASKCFKTSLRYFLSIYHPSPFCVMIVHIYHIQLNARDTYGFIRMKIGSYSVLRKLRFRIYYIGIYHNNIDVNKTFCWRMSSHFTKKSVKSLWESN